MKRSVALTLQAKMSEIFIDEDPTTLDKKNIVLVRPSFPLQNYDLYLLYGMYVTRLAALFEVEIRWASSTGNYEEGLNMSCSVAKVFPDIGKDLLCDVYCFTWGVEIKENR